MEINRISSARIQILLSETELEALDLSYRLITWEDRKTRALIHDMLEIAEQETGFQHKGERMLIEVFEPQHGKCGFLFTLLPSNSAHTGRRHFRVIHPFSPQLYRFDGCEELLSAVQAVAHLDCKIKSRSRLFRLGDAYLLAICPLNGWDQRIEYIFCEFGKKLVYSTCIAAALEEHGQVIAKGDVLSRLITGISSVH